MLRIEIFIIIEVFQDVYTLDAVNRLFFYAREITRMNGFYFLTKQVRQLPSRSFRYPFAAMPISRILVPLFQDVQVSHNQYNASIASYSNIR